MEASESDKVREAEGLWKSGNIEPAVALYRQLSQNARDDQVRLQSSLILIERLKPVDHLTVILEATMAGEESAHRLGEELTRAYTMAKRAEALVVLNGITLVPGRKKLRMAPGWFDFSLEGDKSLFQKLTEDIEKNDADADRLLREAEALALRNTSRATLGHVLMCAGRVYAHRYMNLKVESLKRRAKLPTAVLRLLRPYRLDDCVLYTRDERRQMDSCLAQCERSYLAAAQAFREDGEEAAIAYAFYNLANELRSAFRFRKAKKYLRQARVLAEKLGENRLLPGIKALEKSIKVRNRDTPNYLAGDRRPPIT